VAQDVLGRTDTLFSSMMFFAYLVIACKGFVWVCGEKKGKGGLDMVIDAIAPLYTSSSQKVILHH